MRFESDRVWIELGQESRDCEVFGNLGRSGLSDRVSLLLFLRDRDPKIARALKGAMAPTRRDLRRVVGLMARGLESAGQGLLRGEDAEFEAAGKLRWWHFMPEAVRRPSDR